MSERKTSDAVVLEVLRKITGPSQEASLRKLTKDWSTSDFDYAFDQASRILGWDTRLREILRILRTERETTEQHAEIAAKLEALKKPHWSVAPNFWLTLAILILTAIGTIATVKMLFR
jgi:hypothetical protein